MPQAETRFRFGQNWLDFAGTLTEAQIAEAEQSLQSLLGRARLDGLSFIDIGSGSGLFSLAARRLGARVRSFDFDADSVACTESLKSRYRPGDADWVIGQGSILDPAFVAGLGTYDIVYSWGVLHHTGEMYRAIGNAASLVAPEGIFAIALYRRTRMCWFWTIEKRWFADASPRLQDAAVAIYMRLMALSFRLRGRNFREYVDTYRSKRGMDYRHDVYDWMGGYPYESISPEQVDLFLAPLGFALVRRNIMPYSIGLFGSGCDEFVYRRVDKSAEPARPTG